MKRGVALNAPRIAASALYGVDAANAQIDDYQFAISLDRHPIGDVGAAPKIGPHLAANPERRVQITTRCLGRLSATRRPRCPGNRWADLVARGLPWLLRSKWSDAVYSPSSRLSKRPASMQVLKTQK